MNPVPLPPEAAWHVIACETVGEELKPLLPPGVGYRSLPFGLHLTPQKLRETLQEEIAQVDADVILLGYGLCAQGTVGLCTPRAHLVVPRTDDCIGIFLGSRAAYLEQSRYAPGTYYLTKGWIECGDTPLSEYERMAEKYGPEKARWVSEQVFRNYTRLALINTGQYAMDGYRAYARRVAEMYALTYEEIPGSTRMLRQMVRGQWADEFVVAPPGREITLDMFQIVP
jgi:hypothetical protein